MGYLKRDGTLLHPIANPSELRVGCELSKVRIDDRGDLCVYVVVGNMCDSDVCEEAEEYADRQGWEYDPDDVQPFPILDEAERDTVFDHQYGYTERDLEHMAETAAELYVGYFVAAEGEEDDYRSEIIMTSKGYVEVWHDGDVGSYGNTFNIHDLC